MSRPRPLLLVDVNPSLAILGTPPDAVIGTAYSYTLVYFGGTAPYKCTVVGSVPSGWSFDTATGVLSHPSPAAPGALSLTLKLRDADYRERTQTFAWNVIALPLQITNAAPDGQVGTAYTHTYTHSGGVGAVTWDVVPGSGSVPAGLSLSSGGVLSGTLTTAATSLFTVRATDSMSAVATQDESVNIAAIPLSLSGSFTSHGRGAPLGGSVAITGGVSPYSVTVLSGTAPTTFGVSGATATSSSNVSATGSYSWTLRVTDDNGDTADIACAVTIYYYDELIYAGIVESVIDVADRSSIYTDTAGTTVATTVGDTIKSIRDRVTGNLAVIGSPYLTLGNDGTRDYLQFPASGTPNIDLTMPSALGADSTKSVFWVGAISGGNETLLLFGDNGTGKCLGIGNGSGFGGLSLFQQGAGHGISIGGIGDTSMHTVQGDKDSSATSLTLYSDGTYLNSSSTILAANVTTNTLRLGYYPSLGGYEFRGKLVAILWFNAIPTSGQRTMLHGDAL